jgi:hypothetical protein
VSRHCQDGRRIRIVLTLLVLLVKSSFRIAASISLWDVCREGADPSSLWHIERTYVRRQHRTEPWRVRFLFRPSILSPNRHESRGRNSQNNWKSRCRITSTHQYFQYIRLRWERTLLTTVTCHASRIWHLLRLLAVLRFSLKSNEKSRHQRLLALSLHIKSNREDTTSATLLGLCFHPKSD